MSDRTDRARRPNGTGSITTRDDDALIIRLTDPETGFRHKRIIHRATRDDGRPETTTQHRRRAEQALHALRAEVTRPATMRERWTVSRWADERYLPAVESGGAKPSTVEGYRMIFDCYVRPYVGSVALDRLTPEHVDEMDCHLRSKGLSIITRRHARAALSRILGHAIRKHRLTANPVANADKLAKDSHDPTEDVLEPDQVHGVLTAAKGTPWELPVALLALLGLRRGEVLGLGWDAVDLDVGRIEVRRNLVPLRGGRITLGTPKTPGSIRTLDLSPAVAALLRQQRARQVSHRLTVGPDWQGSHRDDTGEAVGLVFTDEVGRPLPPHRLTAAVKRLGVAADVGAISPHDLRHAAASLMIAEGYDVAAVSATLGHANPAVTLTVYSHAFKRTKAAATAAISEAVGSW